MFWFPLLPPPTSWTCHLFTTTSSSPPPILTTSNTTSTGDDEDQVTDTPPPLPLLEPLLQFEHSPPADCATTIGDDSPELVGVELTHHEDSPHEIEPNSASSNPCEVDSSSCDPAGATSGGSAAATTAGPLSTPPASTMIMDGLDTLTPGQTHHHHHPTSAPTAAAFFVTEAAVAAAAAHHINVLSFEYKESSVAGVPGGDTGGDQGDRRPCSGGSASTGAAATGAGADNEAAAPETQPGDLNTPVTTSGDIPSFFGPSTVVEPPPITGKTSYVCNSC